MADIFISYAREDRHVAERLAAALESYGWSVFWDRRIPAGRRFDEFIEEQLDAGRCIVTLWSSHGVASHWVREESAFGRDRNMLVPARIKQVTPPLGFRSIQCADLIDWAGDEVAPGFRQLMGDLEMNLGAPPEKPSPVAADVQEQEPKAQPVRRSKAKPSAPIHELRSVLEPEMVPIEPGSFVMGSTKYEDEKPAHTVTISYRFEMGKYPVTFAEYDAFCDAAGREKPDDQGWSRGRRPVIDVSWNDAKAYADWLTKETGKSYRLPSEAEWEYCCRAGTTTEYHCGDEVTKEDGNFDRTVNKTTEVGSYPPNPWDLYDMHGNVWEWVEDCWHESYDGAPSDGRAWLDDSGPRVLRGGSWLSGRVYARAASRGRNAPYTRLVNLGFRVVCSSPSWDTDH